MYELGGPLAGRRVEPGASLLIAGAPLTGKRRLGFELLDRGTAADEGVVVVSNRDSADRILERYGPSLDGAPRVGIVDCITKHQGQGTAREADSVRYAASPEDLTGIGVQFSDLLEAFVDDHGVAHNRVLFSSITTLLVYSELETTFRFLDVFARRIERTDALGLFLVDTTAHSREVLATVGQPFDGVIHTSEDGEPDLRLPDSEGSPDPGRIGGSGG